MTLHQAWRVMRSVLFCSFPIVFCLVLPRSAGIMQGWDRERTQAAMCGLGPGQRT